MTRRLFAPLAAVAATAAVSAAAAPAPPTVLGSRTVSGGSVLQRFDARTLRPVGRPLRVAMPLLPWSLSPARSRLALAADGQDGAPGRVRILDTRSLRPAGSVRLPAGGVFATSWPRPGRLVVVGGSGNGDTVALTLVDPIRLRVLRHASVRGRLVRSEPTRDGVVALVAPVGRIGAARLLVADGDLRVRTLALARITAGWEQPATPAEEGTPPPKVRQPGLAVDPAGTHAYVVGVPGEPVSVAELATGVVRSHALVLRRTARVGKAADGTVIWARWTAGRLAVSGSTYRGTASPPRQLGLWLVDPATWTPRLLDPDVDGLVAAGRWLVRATVNDGIVWWDARTGARRQALPEQHPVDVGVHGSLALVRLLGESRSVLLDLRTGRVLGSRAGSPPDFLDAAAASLG